MTTKTLIGVLVLVPGIALAQPAPEVGRGRPMPAVENAFEIAIASGYTQTGGAVGYDMRGVGDLAGPGLTVELDLGYRIRPALSAGVYGSLATYALGNAIDRGSHVLGATAGVQAVWHIAPNRSIDPWLSVGTGWKALATSVSDGPDLTIMGIDLPRIQVGLDVRLSRDVAIAPLLGGSLSTFVARSEINDGYTQIHDRRVQFTGFVGVAGRFDLGGARTVE